MYHPYTTCNTCNHQLTNWVVPPLGVGNWLKKAAAQGYRPWFLETSSLLFKLSLTYPSLAFSDFHLPCLLKRQSGTVAFAAAVALPALKLCRPNSCATQSSNLLVNNRYHWSILILLGFYHSWSSAMAWKCIFDHVANSCEMSNIATGHVRDPVLATYTLSSCLSWYVFASSNTYPHHLVG